MEHKQLIDALWDSLREVACSSGTNAARIVMVHRHDIEGAVTLLEHKQPEVLEELSQRVS